MIEQRHTARTGASALRRWVTTSFIGIVVMGFAAGAGSGSGAGDLLQAPGLSTMPSAMIRVGMDDDPCWPLDTDGRELAWTLASMHTRDARPLVWVMKHGSHADDRLTLHLAIAHAETKGRILAVSASGAAGLAQATPIAILSENMTGPLFLTDDYIHGAEAYFLKKPLGDADTIASYLLAGGDRARAKELLASAWALRTEGFDELDELAPFADAAFWTRRAAAEEENEATLERLGELIEKDVPLHWMREFRDLTRERYRSLRNTQRYAWRAYRDALSSRRDEVLHEVYGVSADRVLEAAAYDAGEILATRLDVRFSPILMADFLAQHLESKREEARLLGVAPADRERFAIGLYNSGMPNMKRMMVGLIGSLPETDRYMKRVPGVRLRLDESLIEWHAVPAAR